MKRGTKHNDSTRNKISAGVKAYYKGETEQQKEQRINKLKQRKFIENYLYKRFIENL